MEYLRCRGWEKYQHYKDGRTMHWHKVHNVILEDYNYTALTDAQRGHVHAIWALACRLDNSIPNDPAWIKQQISANSKVDVNALIDNGFLAVINPVPNDTKRLPRLDKIRLEKIDRSNGFDRWWELYPKKVKKKEALRIWKRDKLCELTDHLIADVQNRLDKCGRFRDYTPDPTTYLNQERWGDDIQTGNKKTGGLPKGLPALVAYAKLNKLPPSRPGESGWDYRGRLEART